MKLLRSPTDSYLGHGFPEYDDTTMREEAEPAMREEAEEEASDEPINDLSYYYGNT